MIFRRIRLVLLFALSLVWLPAAAAQNGDATTEQLRAELDALKREVAELRAAQDRDWMSKRQSEQFQAMVREMLADAETRAGLTDGALTAGYADGFYLTNPAGTFYLELPIHLQVRHVSNFRDDSGGDDTQAGFTLRRAKFKPSGFVTVGERRVEFALSIAADQDALEAEADGDPATDDELDGVPIFEDYYIQTELIDGVAIRAGRWKQPFALQNTTSSARQLAVERANVHEFFAVDRSEGVMVIARPADLLKLYLAINDGADAQKTDFNQDDADFATTARAELLLAGEWDQFKDPAVAWDREPFGLMLGGAVHYQIGETGVGQVNADFLRWTVDATAEWNRFGLLLAGYGQHITDADPASGPETDDFGLLAEAGYFLVPDVLQPYVRYEVLFADGARTPGGAIDMANGGDQAPILAGETDILTLGVNWFQHRHRSKLSVDVLIGLDPIGGGLSSSSLGTATDAEGQDEQVAVRAQYQLQF